MAMLRSNEISSHYGGFARRRLKCERIFQHRMRQRGSNAPRQHKRDNIKVILLPENKGLVFGCVTKGSTAGRIQGEKSEQPTNRS
jgi:hypothetical protein